MGSHTDPKRQFLVRNSLLTQMFTSLHVKSAFNICLSMVMMVFATTCTYYLSDTDAFVDDMGMLAWAFGKVHIFAVVWWILFTSILCFVYPNTIEWLKQSKAGTPNTAAFLVKMVVYIVGVFALTIYSCVKFSLSPVTTFALLCEKVRLLMKIYSFIVESGRQCSDDKCVRPTRKQLIYFLFAPTLIYCNEYPRSPHNVRWKYVAWYFAQLVATIFCLHALLRRYTWPYFGKTGLMPLSSRNLLFLCSSSFLMGAVLVFLLFYGLLHCWLNAWAEMLRFGDRQFYTDWWNSTSYNRFYRTWNTVVHDWLHAYVYQPIVERTSGNKSLAGITTIFASAVIHEYILTLTFGFLYPVLFIQFSLLGVAFYYLALKVRVANYYLGNMFFYVTLFIGWGMLINLYSLEYYARINCKSSVENRLLDLIRPRLLDCEFRSHMAVQSM